MSFGNFNKNKQKHGLDSDPAFDSSDVPMIRGSLFPEDIVRRQIDRCNRSASIDYEAFCRNVEILALNLPSNKLEELDEQEEDYKTTTEHEVFKYVCGFPLGTTENPLKNRKTGDIISPILEKSENVDYYKMYRMVLRLLEEAGLSWKSEEEMIEGGEVTDEDKKYISATPTPTLPPGFRTSHPEMFKESDKSGENVKEGEIVEGESGVEAEEPEEDGIEGEDVDKLEEDE